MAGIKDTRKAAISSWPLAVGKSKKQNPKTAGHNREKPALSRWPLALSKTKNQKRKTKSKNSASPRLRGKVKPRRNNVQRFSDVAGKTVDFIEMDWTADFPCVEVAFDDRTALLFELGARLTLEPMYSNWKSGNQKVLRRWPERETSS